MDCVWRLSKRFLSLSFLVVVVVFRERKKRENGGFAEKQVEFFL